MAPSPPTDMLLLTKSIRSMHAKAVDASSNAFCVMPRQPFSNLLQGQLLLLIEPPQQFDLCPVPPHSHQPFPFGASRHRFAARKSFQLYVPSVICSMAHASAFTRPYCATRLCTCGQSIGMTAMLAARTTAARLPMGIDNHITCEAPLMHPRRMAARIRIENYPVSITCW